ncbi:MAG: helix-turn-helix domain-containing protein [Pirellulaceae bacterium]|nr:helix-turn-helix domain-containing protein [Pirellulaceae bacterium]
MIRSKSITGPALTKLELRRRKLGVSRPVLAKLAGVSLRNLNRILRGEELNPRLATVHAIAQALGVCVGVGEGAGITETRTADAMRRDRATAKARRLAGMVQGTMGLEAQAVDQAAFDSLVERNIHQLLAGPNRRLWED